MDIWICMRGFKFQKYYQNQPQVSHNMPYGSTTDDLPSIRPLPCATDLYCPHDSYFAHKFSRLIKISIFCNIQMSYWPPSKMYGTNNKGMQYPWCCMILNQAMFCVWSNLRFYKTKYITVERFIIASL